MGFIEEENTLRMVNSYMIYTQISLHISLAKFVWRWQAHNETGTPRFFEV